MQAKLLHIRYCAQDYGGRLFTKTQRTTTRNSMCVRGLVNLIDRMRCP
jgi:hypothetical protein